MSSTERDSLRTAATLERSRQRLARMGAFSFWIQVALGVTAGLSWIFVIFGRLFGRFGFSESAGTNLATVTVFLSLLTLLTSLFFTFRQFKDAQNLNGDRLSLLVVWMRRLLLVNLAGILLSVISSAAQTGELLSSTLFGRFSVTFEIPGLLLAVASTNITLSHFVSLVFVLWVLGILDQRNPLNDSPS
ncbi:MAG: DUF3611 family protein [Cyanophyceae cyanobacterium]